jgi:hypothetical protein
LKDSWKLFERYLRDLWEIFVAVIEDIHWPQKINDTNYLGKRR